MRNTIEDIEQEYWGDSDHTYDSNLIKTCFSLRKKNLDEFTIENYRILIGQNFSLEILIPPALEALKKNIFAEGRCYEGDLLFHVLKSDKAYWMKHPDKRQELILLFTKSIVALEELETSDDIRNQLKEAFEAF